MAGYIGYSKSISADYAEECGKFPASILARKLRVSAAAVKEVLRPCEWHHTSSWFKETNYYDGSLLIPLANNTIPDLRATDACLDDLYEAAANLCRMRKFTRQTKAAPKTVYKNCCVRWIEWCGTRRRPVAIEREEDGCTVEYNGKSSYTITRPNGRQFVKRAGTNGFAFFKEAKKCFA